MEQATINKLMDMIPYITAMPFKKIWIDYDEGADVLYINFAYPSEAIEHEEDENGIVRNYNDKGELVGITIIAVSRFISAHKPVKGEMIKPNEKVR